MPGINVDVRDDYFYFSLAFSTVEQAGNFEVVLLPTYSLLIHFSGLELQSPNS